MKIKNHSVGLLDGGVLAESSCIYPCRSAVRRRWCIPDPLPFPDYGLWHDNPPLFFKKKKKKGELENALNRSLTPASVLSTDRRSLCQDLITERDVTRWMTKGHKINQ